jgi:hypothetical protein
MKLANVIQSTCTCEGDPAAAGRIEPEQDKHAKHGSPKALLTALTSSIYTDNNDYSESTFTWAVIVGLVRARGK